MKTFFTKHTPTRPALTSSINKYVHFKVYTGAYAPINMRNRPEHSPSLDTNFLSNATGNKCYGCVRAREHTNKKQTAIRRF